VRLSCLIGGNLTYDDLVQASRDNKGQKVRYKTEIGPTLAQQLLDGRPLIEELGHHQIPFDKTLLTQYTNDQLEGKWRYGVNNIGLHLYKGKLIPINGNHTLQSVVNSGVVITMDVYVNVPVEEFPLYDVKGMGRSAAEQLFAQFKDLTKGQAGVLGDFIPKAYLAIEHNALGVQKATSVSDQTIKDFYLAHKADALEATNFVLEETGFRPNIVALVYFLALRQGLLTNSVLEFLSDLRSGYASRKNNPASKVLAKAQRMGKNFKQRNITATIFYVVNNLLEGKSIGNLLEESTPWFVRVPSPKRTRSASAGS
jgi:hypothetical protein